MSQNNSTDFFSALANYSELQGGLITALKKQHDPLLDWDQIQTIRSVKTGSKISFGGFYWTLSRHGLGCKFTRDHDGLIIDALEKLGSEPYGIDVASFETYLESIAIGHITVSATEIPAQFAALKEAMEEMVIQDKLRKLDRHNRYEIAPKEAFARLGTPDAI